jgi:hypothetical protein
MTNPNKFNTVVTLRLEVGEDGKPRIAIPNWTPASAEPENDIVINYAVAIRDAVENGDLDDAFQAQRDALEAVFDADTLVAVRRLVEPGSTGAKNKRSRPKGE